MKPCSSCGETKPTEEYHRAKRNKDGRAGRCKACVGAYNAERYANNRAEIRIKQAEYNARPEIVAREAARHTRRYAEDREHLIARQAEYRAENRDQILEREARRRVERPNVAWEARFRERAKRYGYPDRTETMESFTKADVIERYGNKCFHCGGPFEHLDHWPTAVIHGGEHSLENCRPSCAECNYKSWRKRNKKDIGETA